MTPLPPLHKMLVSTWDENNYTCFLQPHSTPLVDKSTLCYCLRCSSSQGKELSQPTPHWSIPPISNWGIWLFTQTCRCVFTQLCQCHLELQGDKRPSSFYLGHFFSSKSLDHITKDANFFHFKSSDSPRLSYFLTSTPSKQTSHHQCRSIASHRFLTYK